MPFQAEGYRESVRDLLDERKITDLQAAALNAGIFAVAFITNPVGVIKGINRREHERLLADKRMRVPIVEKRIADGEISVARGEKLLARLFKEIEQQEKYLGINPN